MKSYKINLLNKSIENQFDIDNIFNIWKNINSKKTVFTSSLGQEDQLLTDYIIKNNLDITIVTLDTGRLFQETYDVLSTTEKKYKTSIKSYYPNNKDLEKLVHDQGINGFYKSIENRKSCCYFRKIVPLERSLKNADIWLTGLRQSQSENRSEMSFFEYDEKFKIIKFNPLLKWSYDEVNNYLELNNVPQNKLHSKGYKSIGCAPCTRSVPEGEDLRSGRWWWETSHKECGLHQIKN